MTGSLMAGVLGVVLPARAEEPTTVSLTVEKVALFASPATDAVPNTLTSSFPPGVVCLLRPEFCAENSEAIREPIAGAIATADESAPSEPVQPMEPNSLAVSYEGGNIRYQSAIKFALPTVPEGEEVDAFVVTLARGPASYAVDSPAFRQAVTAAVIGAGEQDPDAFSAEFQEALAEDPANVPEIGIEACPFLADFPESAPPAANSDEDIPTRDLDGKPIPDVDCLYGANGLYDATAKVWTFDLTFTMQAWLDGSLANHGLFLRPTGVPNLAFGDPDTSFSAQEELSYATVNASQATSAPPEPMVPLPPPPPPAEEPVTTPDPFTSQPPPSTTIFSAPVPPPTAAPVFEPEIVEDVAPTQPEEPVLALEPIAAPGPFYLLWLLLPVFLAGMYLTSRSLVAAPVVEAAPAGAMTRLIEHQRALSTPVPPALA